MMSAVLKQGYNKGWFDRAYKVSSEVVEAYLTGFENAFGHFDSVTIGFTPFELDLRLEDGDSVLDSLVAIQVQNPMDPRQNVAEFEIKMALKIDLVITVDNQMIGNVKDFAIELRDFETYFASKAKEKYLKQ